MFYVTVTIFFTLESGDFPSVGGTCKAKISNMTFWNNVSQQLHGNYVLSMPSEQNQGQSVFSIKLRVLQSTAQPELQAHYYQIYHCWAINRSQPFLRTIFVHVWILQLGKCFKLILEEASEIELRRKLFNDSRGRQTTAIKNVVSWKLNNSYKCFGPCTRDSLDY